MTVVHRRRHSLLTAGALTLVAASTLGFGATAATAGDKPDSARSSGEPDSTRSAGEPAQIVVKVRSNAGCSIDTLDARYPVIVDSPVLASRGIYLVHGANPDYQTVAKAAKKLAGRLEKQSCVAYAELDADLHLADTQFHSWQFHSWNADSPQNAGSSEWTEQTVTKQLSLTDAQRDSQGAGVTVAVLDTGIDATHPAFDGRLVPGYDYVSDDADPSDIAAGVDSDGDGYADSAVGHGTFAAGLVTLVAPQAQVIPMRVLDSDGNGNLFVIAQAIIDAADAGAEVINLSFGTDGSVESKLLGDAIKDVHKRGVIVVAAAGNGGSKEPTYPASLSKVISVGALAEDGSSLADFSNRGSWVSVAAPGTSVIGPLPGNRFAAWSGTSMAAPLVAGQMALVAALDGMAQKSDSRASRRQESVSKSARSISGVKFGSIDLLGSLRLAKSS